MTTRHLIVAALVLSAAGCAASKQQERLRTQLDAYAIQKPLAEVWPDALRYVIDRGYDVVGEDRKLLGLPEQGIWSKLLTKGYATTRSSTRWAAESAANKQNNQIRIVGTIAGPRSCRVEYIGIRGADLTRHGTIDADPREYRDLEMELGLIESYDADGAERMARTSRAE